MNRTHVPRGRTRLAAGITLAALLGTGAAALPAAHAATPFDGLHALESLPSGVSSLRHNPDGSPMTAKQRAAQLAAAADDAPGDLGPSDGMGAPADKTVVKADNVFQSTNSSGTGAGNSSTATQYSLNSAMTDVTDAADDDMQDKQRATIDHDYPSVAGHFLSSTKEDVLQLKKSLAGDDAVYSLVGESATAADPLAHPDDVVLADDAPSTDVDGTRPVGGTYTVQLGGDALTNTPAESSAGLQSQVGLTPLNQQKPDPAAPLDGAWPLMYSQQWTLVALETNQDSAQFELVNRADGLCLAHTTEDTSAKFVMASCLDDPSRAFYAFLDGSSFHLYIDDFGKYGVGMSASADGSSLVAVPGDGKGFELHRVDEAKGSVPSWGKDLPGGFTGSSSAAPYALGVGDLDGVTSKAPGDAKAGFHDEAVVAYANADETWSLRVVDYNASGYHLDVTAPSSSITFGKIGKDDGGVWYPGDLIVDVGDFDGDGRNEIATAYQDDTGNFRWTFWRYSADADGKRSLTMLSKSLGAVTPFSTDDGTITLQQGYAASAVGDFDGDGKDDIGLAYATADPSATGPYANIATWTLNSDLSTRSTTTQRVTTPAGNLPPSVTGNPGMTASGLQLKSGHLYDDPDHGYGPRRSQLVLAWSAYDVGPQVGLSDYRPTTIEPVYNTYKLDTTCEGTDCSSTLASTMGQDHPQPLFTSPGDYKLTVYQETKTPSQDLYQAPPLSIEVGGYGGKGQNDPPVDGILANAWMEWNQNPGDSTYDDKKAYYDESSIIVPWVSGDSTGQKQSITTTRTESTAPGGSWQLVRPTAVDRDGRSIVLGEPVVLNVEQQVHEKVLAAEPPTHVDWIDGKWDNVSASSAANLQTSTGTDTAFTSSTENENSWSAGITGSAETKTTFGVGFGPIEEGASLTLKTSLGSEWKGLTSVATGDKNSFSSDVSATTTQDDDLSYSADDYTLYRYPVLGSAGTITDTDTCTDATPCSGYYDVYIPEGSVPFPNVAGKTATMFQPSWENMNALSYPVLKAGANPVPMPDLGSYSFVDSGVRENVTAPLYNARNQFTTNESEIKLSFSSSAGADTKRTSENTLSASDEISATGEVSVGVGYIEGTVSAGFDGSTSLGSTVTASSDTTSEQSFTVNTPSDIDAAKQYNFGTAYYYGQDGAAKVVHGVDLTGNQLGSAYWRQTYSDQPDPALNLPDRIALTWNSSKRVDDIPYWVASPERLLVRGFQALQTSDDATGLPTKGQPYTTNPIAGQGVAFKVPVHNYSLKDMKDGTTATWYAVPIDPAHDTVSGDAVKLGQSTVPAIPAQGSTDVVSPTWVAKAAADGTMQQYRIVVRLDEAGTADDLHPLAGDVCPADTVGPDGGDTLPDIMSNGPDTLACGQDNEGFGLVTVSPAAASPTGVERHATPSEPGNVQLSGAGLLDGDASHATLTASSAVPTVTAGRTVTGTIAASADLQTDSHPIVAVYDGPVSDGKVVALTQMDGVDDETGGHVSFSWTPDTTGLHQLHEVLLGTASSGQDDEQILNVNVAAAPAPYTVTAKASRTTVEQGHSFAVTGSVTPVPTTDGANGRVVELQRQAGSSHAPTWTTVDSTTTSKTGTYAFSVKAGSPGQATYRVVKLATTGMRAQSSPDVTVTFVGPHTATLSAKLSPSKVTVGSSATVSGTLKPAPSHGADRTVQLQQRSGSHWKVTTTTRTDTSGRYSFRVKPGKAGSYAYRVVWPEAGGKAGHPQAVSPTVTLTATQKAKVTAHAAPSRITLGQRAVVGGTVSPVPAHTSGRVVHVQVRSGSHWTSVGTARADGHGRYALSVRPAKAGTYRYRVVWPAGDGHPQVTSSTVTTTVTHPVWHPGHPGKARR